MSSTTLDTQKELILPIDNKDYWKKRKDHDLYRITLAMARSLFNEAKSVIDVGCYTSGLVAEMDWIDRKVASDKNQNIAKNWDRVKDVEFIPGNAFEIDFQEPFDLVLSNQTIEHMDQPAEFVEKLLKLGRGLIISTTYETPAGMIKKHVQDPIDFDKFLGWFPCDLDSWTICYNPYRNIKHIIAVIKQSHPNRKS